MTEHTWADMADDELDAALRREMAVLQASAPVPAVDAVAIQRRARPRFLLGDPAHPRRLAPAAMAVGIAVLLAVGSGTWYAVERLHGRNAVPAASPNAVPSPTAAPTPLTSAAASPTPLPAVLFSTVPPDVPVFYYISRGTQPRGGIRLEAVDWSGARRGEIDIPGLSLPQDSSTGLGILQSPDGERLLYGDNVYASNGHLLYTVPPAALGRMMWADDSRSLCSVTGRGTTAAGVANDLVVVGPDGTTRPTEDQLGTTGNDAAYFVEACSVSSDRVVAYVQVSSAATTVRVSQLSSNRTLLDQSLCPSGSCGYNLGNISVTPEGRVAAESDQNGQVRLRDLTTGRVRSLAQRGGVIQLSADGTRLLLGRPSFDFSSRQYPLTLVDVATGRVLWSHSQEGVLGTDVGTQPGGSTIAVAYHDIDATATPGPNNYMPLTRPSTLVLLSDGGTTTIATNVHSMLFGFY